MRNRPFTPDEDAAIAAQWSRGPLAAIAAALGRDPKALHSRARLLVARGVLEPAQQFYHRPWTEADEDLLKDLLGAYPLSAVAKRLRRSVDAVEIRKKRLGLTQRDTFLTLRDVARVVGVDDHLVRRWIDAGLLKGRRAPVRVGGNRLWRCEVEDLTRFLQQHPTRYDRRRIEDEPFRTIAREAYRADPVLTVTEAARQLGVCPETVRRHLRQGWLTGERVPIKGNNGVWLVRRSALASFRPRNPATTHVVVLRSVAGENAQRIARHPAAALRRRTA